VFANLGFSVSGVILFPNEKHTFVGASLATPGLITVHQQRASQAKPLHGSASKVSFLLGKGIILFPDEIVSLG
jgi:hypothetical protein